MLKKIHLFRPGILILIALVFFAATVTITHAQQQKAFVPLDKTLEKTKVGTIYQSQDLTTFINRLFFLMISIGGMLAVGKLCYAGWLYMMGESYGSVKKAKGIVGNVVIGLLLLLSIWLILKLINPEMLNLDVLKSLKDPAFSSGGSSGSGTTGGTTGGGSTGPGSAFTGGTTP
jgi:uncharacterized membrane protein YgcG